MDIHSLEFCTDVFFIPTNFKDELCKLQRAFVCLYSLLDLFISIGDGAKPRLAEMLNKFKVAELVDSFFNPENLTDARERTNRAIVQRQGQSKFRSELLKAYGGKCAITTVMQKQP